MLAHELVPMEIIVDAYDAEEQAMGWFCYLEDTLTFPFVARCRFRRSISPLQDGDDAAPALALMLLFSSAQSYAV